MAKLWLTYAWRDNEDQDVDHVIAELRAKGLEVNYDRAHLLAGRRLWDQIDSGINDPGTKAWAILVTENSLRSEACQEEIAYALDRTLRVRGSQFPLIGIFPSHIDRTIIPSALATRLYVDLRMPGWAQQVADGVTGTRRAEQADPPAPFGHMMHSFDGKPVLEVWPRSGRWIPFAVLVHTDEIAKLGSVMFGPRGLITGSGIVSMSTISSADNEFKGEQIQHSIDANTSAHIFLNEIPTKLKFGQPGQRMYVMKHDSECTF